MSAQKKSSKFLSMLNQGSGVSPNVIHNKKPAASEALKCPISILM